MEGSAEQVRYECQKRIVGSQCERNLQHKASPTVTPVLLGMDVYEQL